MDGDDITKYNTSMPRFPREMPLWQRVMCLLGYHKRETRKTGPMHETPNVRLRDQCGRCNTWL